MTASVLARPPRPLKHPRVRARSTCSWIAAGQLAQNLLPRLRNAGPSLRCQLCHLPRETLGAFPNPSAAQLPCLYHGDEAPSPREAPLGSRTAQPTPAPAQQSAAVEGPLARQSPRPRLAAAHGHAAPAGGKTDARTQGRPRSAGGRPAAGPRGARRCGSLCPRAPRSPGARPQSARVPHLAGGRRPCPVQQRRALAGRRLGPCHPPQQRRRLIVIPVAAGPRHLLGDVGHGPPRPRVCSRDPRRYHVTPDFDRMTLVSST